MKKLSWNDPKNIDLISKSLQTGNIGVGTSDTVIGFLAPLTDNGFAALNQIKGRQEKPYLILVKDIDKAKQFSDDFNNPKINALVQRFWPGPLTIIVTARKDVPAYMQSKDGTIAIRVPDHKGLQRLLERFKGLFSTSANKAGEPIPSNINSIHSDILKKIDFIITDDGRKEEKIPSTIIDCTQEPYIVVREGAIKKDQLRLGASEVLLWK